MIKMITIASAPRFIRILQRREQPYLSDRFVEIQF